MARQFGALKKNPGCDDSRRNASELCGDDCCNGYGTSHNAAVHDSPCSEVSSCHGIDGREQIRHRRWSIGRWIVVRLASQQQAIPRDALVGFAPVFIAPVIPEATSLPDVECNRIVVVTVARLRWLTQRATVRCPHDIDRERREE